MNTTTPLRSAAWFARKDLAGFVARSWMKKQGVPDVLLQARPVIAIVNTASDLVPCNAVLTRFAEAARRGVLCAGGFPVVVPVMSLGETLVRPSAMLYRNLMSMDVESTLRSNPIDAVLLLGGCDKTTPALLMGAASVNLPTAILTSGPMLNGKFRGRTLGSGTDVFRMVEDLRAGRMTPDEFRAAECGMSRSDGHCMTMGTASTMACMAEALGLAWPGSGSIPAVDAERERIAYATGQRLVQMALDRVRMSEIVTRDSFANAIRLHAALGGSTNAVIHLTAIAGRLGLNLTLEDWDRESSGIPLLANLQPNGEYLMEEFCYAGGLPALIAELRDRLHLHAMTVCGQTWRQIAERSRTYAPDVIRPIDRPVKQHNGLAVLRGNLAPNGAVLKPSAATPDLLRTRGRAVVFRGIDDLERRIDDPALDVDERSVLVLQEVGPRGYPGMPEVGNFRLPRRMSERGVRDMVRISDGRMSGTAYGTVVLHVAPESAAGGPLALVRDGDYIGLDVEARTLSLEVSAEELARRRDRWQPVAERPERGYEQLYWDHVLQADRGCDFDFLVGGSGDAVPRLNY